MSEETNIEKVCSFCVSNLHLVTMLLPYLDKKIKTGEKFITIFEKDLETEVKLVLSRLLLSIEEKGILLNINWKTSDLNTYKTISTAIYDECRGTSNLSIIINGSKEYIENVNNILAKFFECNNLEPKIKIINCYDITKLDDDIKTILKTHDKILNTSGEKEISEVFEGYEKRKLA